MKVSTTQIHRERRAQSDPPSVTVSHENMKKLLESPYFKRLVQLHVNLRCRQALKDGKIRLASPRNHPVYTPRVDIVDDSNSSRVVATFELPGVKNDEVTMHLHDGKLHIQGERFPRAVLQTPGHEGASSMLSSGNSNEDASDPMVVDTPRRVTHPTQELKYGKFQRALDVPSGLRHSDITARFQDGMLIVTWPRQCATDMDLTPHASVAREEHS